MNRIEKLQISKDVRTASPIYANVHKWQLLNQCDLFISIFFLNIQIQVPPTTSLLTTKDVRSAISNSTVTRVASFILRNSPAVTAISPTSVTPSHLSQKRDILASSSIVSQPGEQLFQSLLCQTINNALMDDFTIDQSQTLVYVLLANALLRFFIKLKKLSPIK